jgi:hypothetical protein
VPAPRPRQRRARRAASGRASRRAGPSDFAVVRDVRRLAEAETWVEVTPKRLSALHEAGLPA